MCLSAEMRGMHTLTASISRTTAVGLAVFTLSLCACICDLVVLDFVFICKGLVCIFVFFCVSLDRWFWVL